MDANGQLLRQAFEAALDAARPERWLAPALARFAAPPQPLRVLALGKAARAMAEVFARAWRPPFEGLVVAPYGQGGSPAGFDVVEAAHPVPDEGSVAAGEAILAMAGRLRPGDQLLLLLSGGASALACAPIEGVSLELKAELTRRLLRSGLEIRQVNTIRQAVSRLKGGGLLRAAGGADVVSLIQSDVPMDDVAVIGSAPGVPTPPPWQAALDALGTVAPDLLPALADPVRRWAAKASAAHGPWRAEVLFGVGDGAAAAAAFLRERGVEATESGQWNIDAETAAAIHAAEVRTAGPGALVTSGETTVAVPAGASGRGGRNQHFLLSLAVEMAGRRDIWALAADTDGIDGASGAAGAWIDPALLETLDVGAARAALAAFDAHGFFERQGRLIQTGPTGVNVGDLRMVLVE